MRKGLILLTFMMLAVRMIAGGPDFYLAGSCNGWTPNSPNYKFTEDNGVYTLSLPVLTGDFKITTSAWEIQYGCASKIAYGHEYRVVQSDNAYNITLPDDPAKGVVITFDYNKKTIRFDLAISLYLTGDFNDWLLLPDYEFSYSDGLYTLSVPPFEGKFKVVTRDNDRTFTTGSSVAIGSETKLNETGSGMELSGVPANAKLIKITVNPSAERIEEPAPGETVEPEEPQDPEEETPDLPAEEEPGKEEPTPEPEQPGDNVVGEEPGDTPSEDEPSIEVPPADIPGNDDGDNSVGNEPSLPADPDDSQDPSDTPTVEEPTITPEQPGEGGDPSDSPEKGEPDDTPEDPGQTPPGQLPGEETPDDEKTPGEGDDEQGYVSSIIDDTETEVQYFDLTGRKIEHPSGGIFIYRNGKEARKVYIP